ncbi:wall-associated receptor kinase-like 1 isoform X2 [Salvia hispanica]|uniref:wall-associated receptor kinase-like 1 isoform X2 n=1 Tax=Salvia hispanica TaxID=49212 RepID=UPI002009299D|nr:wall-associated receptor kinase-like 1 isoform X2 [Salvia hispanica]
MCPLQLIISIILLLPQLLSAALLAKPGCEDRCGDLLVPYPFGFGPNCSLNPYFDINCDSSTNPPKAYLSIMKKQVIEFNQTYIRLQNPFMISACYDEDLSTHNQHSMTMNLSGTPYMLSGRSVLTAIGCDDMVLQYKGSSTLGGCSAFCADKNDAGFGDCHFNGCCHQELPTGTKFVEAKLIDLSGSSQRKKLFPCSYAFIQETNWNEAVFSYRLYYLNNSTALVNDNWASATRPPVVRLDWVVGAESCSQAKNSSTTYSCLDEKSVCVDYQDSYNYVVRGVMGYRCSCVQGYEGNPYLRGGCQTISSSSSIAKPGCIDQCGKVSIPFPFGVGPNCYLEPSFEVVCNKDTNPATPFLSHLNTEIIQLNSSKIVVNNRNLSSNCYNGSDYQAEPTLTIDLLKTQYRFSDDNWINAVGCNVMAVGVIGEDKRSSIRSSCAAICSDSQIYDDGSIFIGCDYGITSFAGTTYLELNMTDLSEPRTSVNISCSYAFTAHAERMNANDRYSIGTSLDSNRIPSGAWPSMALDWRIGPMNCKEARQDLTNFICRDNSDCVDFDAMLGGYLCNYSKGYIGNPYLNPGCQDIDECDDNTTNTCVSNSTCQNSPGTFHCLCPKGYIGDGKKDGTGCIPQPPSKTKMIILIGIGSGMGFLLLVSVFFWLHKLLQKRKEKIVKDKFFKRNGGLLLQQHTNEGALGKTKVFRAKELEVATDNFNESRIIGQGGQGTVYKGMLYDGKIVAIKKSKLVEVNQLEQFINEVVILSQINHRNVVKLFGCCLETEVPLLVYEFMPNGTLFDLIHDPSSEFPCTWNMLLKIAADIAGALAYLHSASSVAIYHRDIKSSNILLDEKYVAKVSDFGTSRSVATDQTHLTTLVKGTFGYLDPEYFRSSQFTEKSDVYSFGVVLVELLTGQRPISLDKTEEERGLATRFLVCMEEGCMDTILDPQVREQGRKEEVALVAKLAQRCLNLKGIMRPTMKEVATELESFRISEMSSSVNVESEDVRSFGDMPAMISDTEYTWTNSYNNASALSSDAHPLMLFESAS